MKIRTFPLLAALGALALPAALANHIDFIVDGGFMISNAGGDPASTAAQLGDGGNIIGAEREVTLSSDLDTMTATLLAPAGAGPVGPGATFIGVTGDTADALGTLELLYNGTGSIGLNGGAGADFDTVWNSFGVDLLSVTGGSLDLRVRAGDTNGNMGEVAIADITSAGFFYFSFTNPGFTNAGVDFTSLDSVKFSFESTLGGTQYQIGGLTREVAVPEPTASLLAVVGVFGLAMRRRRRA